MPRAVAQALANNWPEHDAGVFDRVMLIHIQIALRVD